MIGHDGKGGVPQCYTHENQTVKPEGFLHKQPTLGDAIHVSRPEIVDFADMDSAVTHLKQNTVPNLRRRGTYPATDGAQ